MDSLDGTFFYQVLYAARAITENRQILGLTQVNLAYDIV